MNKKEERKATFLWYVIVIVSGIFAVAGVVVGYRLASHTSLLECKETKTINVYEENAEVKDFSKKYINGHVLPGYYDDTYKGDLLSDENLKLVFASSYINNEEIPVNVDYTTGIYFDYSELVKKYKELFGNEFDYKTYPNMRMDHMYQVDFRSWNEDFTKEDNCNEEEKETCYATWNSQSKSNFTMKVENIEENIISGKITVHQDEKDTFKHTNNEFEIEVTKVDENYIISKFTIK